MIRRRSHGFTLTEVMMATAVGAIFLTGLIAAFIQVLKTTDRTQAISTAVANGRVALDMIGTEIKQANFAGDNGRFVGLDNPAPFVLGNGNRYGNATDEDGDGAVDEEILDGLDNDGDWTDASDRHAVITAGRFERPAFVGQPDLGDERVDEDLQFENDMVTFWIVPSPNQPQQRDVSITFSIGSYEGRDHMLLKTIRTPAGDPDAEPVVAPVAENVLSFSALYWMPNGATHNWLTAWDSAGSETTTAPGLRLPAAVHLALQVYSDDKPIESWHPGEPVKVETVSTVINIEQVINDSRYPRS